MSELAYLAERQARAVEKSIPASLKFTRSHGLVYAPKALGGRNLRAPIRKKPDLRGPLGPGEYYHGTSREGAARIKEQGFSLVDPRGPSRGGDALRAKDKSFNLKAARYDKVTTRAGRPKSSGDFGPGVYVTENKRVARGFAGYVDTKGRVSHLIAPRGRGEVLKVRVEGKVYKPGLFDPSLTTPQAAKRGYVGTKSPYGMDQTAIGNPRKVHVVPTKMRYGAGWTPGEYALAGAGVGGAGYGGHRLHEHHQQKGKTPLKKVGTR